MSNGKKFLIIFLLLFLVFISIVFGFFLGYLAYKDPVAVEDCGIGAMFYHTFLDGVICNRNVIRKPAIYLYPTKEEKVSVSLNLKGEITKSIPQLNTISNSWDVSANANGNIKMNDKSYDYLFWEGITNHKFSIAEGFSIKGSDTERFLNEKLTDIGLSEKEKFQFIEYWLPYMKGNKYNTISFIGKDYTDLASLNISPKPDSILRVFMVFQATDKKVELPLQKLENFNRVGFAVVEWGGTEIK